jgi:hypothetical protein
MASEKNPGHWASITVIGARIVDVTGMMPVDDAIREWQALPWHVRLYWWVRG